MRKATIKTSEDGYKSLYKDLHFCIDNNIITKDCGEHTLELATMEEYEKFYNMLSQFSLDDSEKRIISLRYGLATGRALTFTDLGKLINYSDEYIRVTVRRAQRKLTHRVNMIGTIGRWNALGGSK